MISTLILEDNISVAIEMEMMLEKLGVNVLKVEKSWIKALDQIRLLKPDFLIIDLFLNNNESGMDLIQHINDLKIPFIICTGYPLDKFLNKAYELGAHAFFSKPLDKAAFKYKIKTLKDQLHANKDYHDQKTIVLKSNRSLLKVSQREILYIEVDGNYTTVHLKDSRKFILKKSLSTVIKELDPTVFERCHRTTAINVSELINLDLGKSEVILTGDVRLPLGNMFRKDIKGKFLSDK